ncbi:alpha/beta-hydrolase [Vararia minispora EC-137]|uniref:Alpha/beta-hydrolase n=1 Tax=Vararia minispora EC-137 TaxID=1314806 RepID=A0ACB8R0F8_9AGAM|nr:alpha/beta-hydrolase [Vararia minispora EC-137]
MDPSKFKQTTVSRGFVYSYYRVPASDPAKLTILLLHGFPSTADDWAGIVPHLEKAGYGLIVPDMLGYRGTSKPTDSLAYIGSKIAKDCVDILDAEGLEKVVVVGHDWGSCMVSKLVNYFPERFEAFGFIAVGYMPPNPTRNWEEETAKMKQFIGFDIWGYMPFMARDTTPKLIEEHMDSFLSLLFAKDIYAMMEYLCPPDSAEAWLKADKKAPILDGVVATPEVRRKKDLLEGGLTGPLCWYKAFLDHMPDDDKNIPPERYLITKPVFYGECTYDSPTPPKFGEAAFQACGKGPMTRGSYPAGHWAMLTHHDEIGKDLVGWLAGL